MPAINQKTQINALAFKNKFEIKSENAQAPHQGDGFDPLLGKYSNLEQFQSVETLQTHGFESEIQSGARPKKGMISRLGINPNLK